MQQSWHFSPVCHCIRPLRLALLASSPKGGAKGGCAAGVVRSYPLRWAGLPAPWLSLWESWHGVAVTERVPGGNHGTFTKFATACALSGSPLARQLPQRGSQGAADSRPVVSLWGNNVGALRRQWKYRIFANEIWWYYVETWYIGNIGALVGV